MPPPKKTTTGAIVTAKASVTFHYFDLYARGEFIRVLLKLLKIDFIDHRISFEEWPSFKASGVCEFGQVPMLEMEGKQFVTGRAIARYLAMKNGLYPTSPKEIYELESVCDFVEEIYDDSIEDMVMSNKDAVEKYKTELLFKKLKVIEARFVKSLTKNSEFFVGKTITLADIYVLSFLYDYFLTPKRKEEYEGYLQIHAPKLDEFAKYMLDKHMSLKQHFLDRTECHA